MHLKIFLFLFKIVEKDILIVREGPTYQLGCFFNIGNISIIKYKHRIECIRLLNKKTLKCCPPPKRIFSSNAQNSQNIHAVPRKEYTHN